MNKQRLLILANHLEKHVEPREFDMSFWRYDAITCGTAACACGHAASIPAFQKLGFLLEEHVRSFNGTDYTLVFGDFRGWIAVKKFFEIDTEDAYYLFSSGQYTTNPTPKEVATRIKEFIERDE
jgi:hypothetical protein